MIFDMKITNTPVTVPGLDCKILCRSRLPLCQIIQSRGQDTMADYGIPNQSEPDIRYTLLIGKKVPGTYTVPPWGTNNIIPLSLHHICSCVWKGIRARHRSCKIRQKFRHASLCVRTLSVVCHYSQVSIHL